MSIARDLSWRLDPVLFAEACGVELDPWQAELLRTRPRKALLNCSRQSGKSTVSAIWGLFEALMNSTALVVIASPSQNQSAEMLRTIRQLHGELPAASVPAINSDQKIRSIEFDNGSRILALPGTEKTVRGLSKVRLAIVDEASRVPDELITATRPFLAVSNGSLVMLSTPAGLRGKWSELWHNGDASWERIRVPASACPRISQEFLDEQMRELGPLRFSEEYELAFVDDLTAAFSTALIDRAFRTDISPIWL